MKRRWLADRETSSPRSRRFMRRRRPMAPAPRTPKHRPGLSEGGCVKVAYPTRAAAEAAIIASSDLQRAYHCERCLKWHTTTWPSPEGA